MTGSRSEAPSDFFLCPAKSTHGPTDGPLRKRGRVGRVPQLGMVGEGGIRMGNELGMKVGFQFDGDGGGRAGWRDGCKVETGTVFGKPAFERARTDGEVGDDLRAWHATLDRSKHALS